MNLFGAIGNGLHRLTNDVTHPFGMGNPPQPQQPVRTPAPMQQPAQRPMVSTPSPGMGVMRPGIAPIAQPRFTAPQVAQMRQQPAPHPSLLQDAGHIAGMLGHMAGGAAQSIVRSGMALPQQIGNAEVGIAHAMGKAQNVHTLNGQQFVDQSIGNRANKLIGYTGTGRQMGLDAVNNASWLLPGAGKAVGNLAERTGLNVAEHTAPVIGKTLGNAAGKVTTKLVNYGGHADIGGATTAVQGAAQEAINNPHANIRTIATAAKNNFVPGAIMGGTMPVIHDAAPLVAPAVKAADTKLRESQGKVATDQSINSQQRQLQKQAAELQKRQDALPVGHPAVEQYQRKIDNLEAQHQALEQSRPNVTRLDKVLATQPGGSVGGPNALGYMLAKKQGRVFEGVDGKPRFEIDDSGAKILPHDMSQGGFVGDVLDHPELYKNYPGMKNVPIEIDPKLKGNAALDDRTGTLKINPKYTEKVQTATGDMSKITPQAIEDHYVSLGYPREQVQAELKGMSVDDIVKNVLGQDDINKITGLENPEYHTRLTESAKQKLLHELQHEVQHVEGTTKGTDLRHGDDAYFKSAGEAEARAVEKRMNFPASQRYQKVEPSYKSLDAQSIHKQPNLTNKQLDSLSPEAIDALKQQGFKGVSNGKRTVRFDESNKIDGMGKPLEDEARKYKSADEFIASQQPLYHGTKEDWTEFDPSKAKSGGGLFTTSNKSVAEGYTFGLDRKGRQTTGLVKEFYVSPDMKLADQVTLDKIGYTKVLEDYDGLVQKVGNDTQTTIFKPEKLLTKEKLTDIYNQSKTSPASKSQPATSLRSTFYDSLDVPKDQLIVRHGDGPVQNIPDELKPLAEEAKKYKSAEEFAKAFEFHGGPKNLEGGKLSLAHDRTGGVFTTPDKRYAQIYKDKNPDGAIHQVYTGDKKIIDLTDSKAAQEVKGLIGKKFTDVDGEERTFTRDDFEFMFPGGKADWATFSDYTPLLEQAGYKGARIAEHADFMGEGKLLKSTALFNDTNVHPENFDPKAFWNQVHGNNGIAMSIDKPTAPVTPATPTPALPEPAAKRQLPASRETVSESLPDNSKQRGFVTSVKASDEVSGKTKQMTTGKYTPRSTAQLQAGAEQVAGGDLNQATNQVHDALNQKVGTINDKNVADSIAVAKAHDAAGNHQQSSDIYEKLAEHLTKQGQSIQAASLLSHQTPEGLQYGAQKALKKAGVDLTPELQGKLQTAINEVRNAKPGTERDYAVKKLQKMVSDNVPTNLSDKISSVWKAGLLTGVKTQTGNWLSNGTFQVLHTASNPLAVGIDKAISKFTGVRTKSLTNKGIGSGLGEGIQNAGKYLKTGIDERTAIDNKYDTHGEVNFKNKALNTYVNGVFRLMGAADRPTYYSQLRNSLHDLALTDAANKGIPKGQIAAHVSEFTKNPPSQAFQTATNEAEKAVLGNDTALSNIIGGVRQSTQQIKNPLARGTANAAVNFVAPFTKVPSAFLNRVIDFSPVGAVKEAALQMADGKLDQRALSTALSEATTGSALIYLGYQAAKNNLLSGNYPANDQKEAQRWKAEGIQPNAIKVGNKWLSLNYFGPLGLLFNAGQRVNDAAKQGQSKAGQGIAAVAGAPKDLMGQSFLQGLSGFTNAINDPTRSAKTYLNSQGSSIVPTIVGDVANATDKMQRQADTLGQAIQNKLPGLRQGLNPKQDVYGNPLQQPTSGANQLANPLRPSTSLTDKNPAVAEVNRLHTVDPNNKDLQVTPTPVQKVVSIDKTKVPLTNQQAYDLQKQVGQTTQDNWNKLIATPEYKAMSDTDKAKALNNMRQDATELATRQYVTDNNLGTYAKPASKGAAAVSSGNVSRYTSGSLNGTTISNKIDPHSQKVLQEYAGLSSDQIKQKAYNEPSYDYKVAEAKYQNDLANGKLSTTQKITRQAAVQKAQAGSNYSKDVRDLYGLSKAELAGYLTTQEPGVNKQQLGDQLQQYDKALYNAGLTSSLKYKDGVITNKNGSLANTRSSGSTASQSGAVSKASVSYSGLNAGSKAASGKFRVPGLKTGMGSSKVSIKSYKVPKATKLASAKRSGSRVNLNTKLPKRSTLV